MTGEAPGAQRPASERMAEETEGTAPPRGGSKGGKARARVLLAGASPLCLVAFSRRGSAQAWLNAFALAGCMVVGSVVWPTAARRLPTTKPRGPPPPTRRFAGVGSVLTFLLLGRCSRDRLMVLPLTHLLSSLRNTDSHRPWDRLLLPATSKSVSGWLLPWPWERKGRGEQRDDGRRGRTHGMPMGAQTDLTLSLLTPMLFASPSFETRQSS